MINISEQVSTLENRLNMTEFLRSVDKDPLIMKYWDEGNPFLRDISKSPLPINFAIDIKNRFPKFN